MSEPTPRSDETTPGGDYLAADGKTHVDAWGKPITQPKSAAKPAPKRAAKKASTS